MTRLLRRLVDAAVNALARVGLVRVREDGSVAWPFHVVPWVWWGAHWWPATGQRDPVVGVFRNLPGVVWDIPGRLLPRRWGFWVLGFEFGDRGGGPSLVLRRGGRGAVEDGP